MNWKINQTFFSTDSITAYQNIIFKKIILPGLFSKEVNNTSHHIYILCFSIGRNTTIHFLEIFSTSTILNSNFGFRIDSFGFVNVIVIFPVLVFVEVHSLTSCKLQELSWFQKCYNLIFFTMKLSISVYF